MEKGEATKGKEARGSEQEGEEAAVESIAEGTKMEKKKKDRRRSKLFRETTATLRDVRCLDMLLKFRPLPNQHVLLDVPEDVDVAEFVNISRYADDKCYTIVNEREMVRLMLQRAQNMLVRKVEGSEGEEEAAAGGARPPSDEGGRPRSASTGCSTTGGRRSSAWSSRSA